MSKICCNFARFFKSAVHSYIGITPDFGSEKRGSTPRWTTRGSLPQAPPYKEGCIVKKARVMEYTVLSNTNMNYCANRMQ